LADNYEGIQANETCKGRKREGLKRKFLGVIP
jgi:hypothetical protein